ncbi:hypothetical protein AALA52_03785 [Lactococcus ileimucosae]|uniref:Phage protein n=1 Tax=Lactococcus ileimucosae TaxID=2941329 RepID=A0ABV4D1G8_9LACT|nr:hypothetical protein [Lactococcus ileimucosae]
MSKKVYKVSGKNFTEWEAPDDEVIVRPFTEVKPPEEEGKLITGFDWVENKWETVEVVSPQEFEQANLAIFELASKVSQLEKEK